jgi:hypothetical protein
MNGGPYRARLDSPPWIEPRKSWRWAAYACCFLVGGVLARAVGATCYGWAVRAADPGPCVEKLEPLTSYGNTVYCHPKAYLEVDDKNPRVICRCRMFPTEGPP